jgi:hypothetical protein
VAWWMVDVRFGGGCGGGGVFGCRVVMRRDVLGSCLSFQTGLWCGFGSKGEVRESERFGAECWVRGCAGQSERAVGGRVRDGRLGRVVLRVAVAV